MWQSKESDQLALPSSHLSGLSLLQHPRLAIITSQWQGGPEGAGGWGCHGRCHSDHGCTLTCLKQSDLDSTKGAFGDLCLQNCEELEEISVRQPWMLLPASGTVFRRSHLWGSPGFHCPAAPWSAGYWRSHPALHFHSFPKLLPQTIL